MHMRLCNCPHGTTGGMEDGHGHRGARAGEDTASEGGGSPCIGCEFCSGFVGNAVMDAGDHVPPPMVAEGSKEIASHEVQKHMTSVEVKVEKVLQEGTHTRELLGVLTETTACRGGAPIAAQQTDVSGPGNDARAMAYPSMEGQSKPASVAAHGRQLGGAANRCPSASTPEPPELLHAEVKEADSQRISKRTGKPVRKYARKIKTEVHVDESGGGTGSFVGEVVAIIDKIAARAEDNMLRGVTGEHIPPDSDDVNKTPQEVAPVRDIRRSKQKMGAGTIEGTSAGSGNRRAVGKKPIARMMEGRGSPGPPARQFRQMGSKSLMGMWRCGASGASR